MRIAMRKRVTDGAHVPVTQLLPQAEQDFYCLTNERHTMTDHKQPNRYTGVDRRAPRTDGGANANALPREAYKTGGRHAAITNSLYNWHSYKNWAEKVRVSWDDKK
jgi:hypothetical protein